MYNGNSLTSWNSGCANKRTIMHELGHNMGFHHSIWENAPNVEYGDPTCLMGGSYEASLVSSMCSDKIFEGTCTSAKQIFLVERMATKIVLQYVQSVSLALPYITLLKKEFHELSVMQNLSTT